MLLPLYILKGFSFLAIFFTFSISFSFLQCFFYQWPRIVNFYIFKRKQNKMKTLLIPHSLMTTVPFHSFLLFYSLKLLLYMLFPIPISPLYIVGVTNLVMLPPLHKDCLSMESRHHHLAVCIDLNLHISVALNWINHFLKKLLFSCMAWSHFLEVF